MLYVIVKIVNVCTRDKCILFQDVHEFLRRCFHRHQFTLFIVKVAYCQSYQDNKIVQYSIPERPYHCIVLLVRDRPEFPERVFAWYCRGAQEHKTASAHFPSDHDISYKDGKHKRHALFSFAIT